MSGKIFTLKNKRHMPKGLAWLFACVLQLVAWTYRFRIEDPHHYLEKMLERPCAAAVWHNRILFFVPRVKRSILKHCSVLISASRDGEYIATIIRFFGLQVVRGSSSRGGVHALLGLMDAVRNGLSAVFTVDGPRGPRYTVHPGVVAVAAKCGVPVMPACLNARHKWQLKSWDRMQIPWPFSKVTLVVGETFMIPEDMPAEEACELVRKNLLAITED